MTDRVIRIKLDTTDLQRGGARVEKSLDNIDRRGRAGAAALRTLAAAATGVVAALGLRSIASYADSWSRATSRIRLVTDSTDELAAVQDELVASANRTRSSFESTVELYARVARSSDELGLSQERLLGFTETVNQAIQVGGNTAAEASNGVIQFSQGLAAGALRGDELRSVLEQMPRLAQALANGLGVGIGQLRELGEAGELTTERVLEALENQAPQIAAEFAQLAPTISSALVVVQNEIQATIGELDQASGVSRNFAENIIDAAGDIGTFANAVNGSLDPTDELSDTLKTISVAAVGVGAALNVLGTIVVEAVTLPFRQAGLTVGAFFAAFNEIRAGNFSNVRTIFSELAGDAVANITDLKLVADELVIETADAFERINAIFDQNARTSREPRDVDLGDTGGGSGFSGGAGSEEEQKITEAERLIAALQEQTDTFGLNAEEIAKYKLELAGATQAQIAFGGQLAADLSILEDSARLAEEQAESLKRRQEELARNQESDAEFIASLRTEIDLIGQSDLALASFENVQRLSADATREQIEETKRLTEEMFAASEAQRELEEAQRRIEIVSDDVGRAASDSLAGIVRGFDSASDAAENFLNRLVDIAGEALIFAPLERGISNLFSGGAGGGGIIESIFGGLPAFATGGQFRVGGRGGTDNNIVAFRASDDETVTVTPAGQNVGSTINNFSFNNVSDMDSFRRSRTQTASRTLGIAQREIGRTR